MKYIKHTLGMIDGVAVFPIIAFVIFFIFFVLLIVWVLTTDGKQIEYMKNLPFTGSGEQKNDHKKESNDGR